MSKTTLLGVIISVLLLCNIGLMWKLWDGKKFGPQGGEGPRLQIISRLDFDTRQIEEYDVLVHQHRSLMRQEEDKIRSLKKSLYQTLIKDFSSRDSLIMLIANEQKEVERINLSHFADIGKLCRPDQQVKYAKLVSDLSELFMHRKPPPPAN